jgi:phage gpG-like protein
MIEIVISGTYPKFDASGLPATMEKISDLLYETLGKNFAEGGRPTEWPMKRTPVGGRIPSFRGRTFWRISKWSGENFAEAGLNNPRIYDYANEFGAEPHPVVTKASKGYFWHMFELTGNEMWKWMALKRVGSVLNPIIPPRPAFLFQEEDTIKIAEMLKGAIYEMFIPQPVRTQ